MPSVRQNLVMCARDSAKWRGHKLGRFSHDTILHGALAVCKVCGKGAVIDLDPPPNGIAIGGEAVAVNCTKRGEKNGIRRAPPASLRLVPGAIT